MFSIDKKVYITHPGTKMGILMMKGVSSLDLCAETQVAQDLDELRRKYSPSYSVKP